MTKKEIIDGLKMTMELFLFNPMTGEQRTVDSLNGLDRTTYESCKGAIELLEQPEQPKKTLYKHFKGGIYELIAPLAMNTEGNEIYTIYKSVKTGTVWARSHGMFFGNVVNDKGEIVPRFVLYQPQEEQQEGDAE